MLSACVSSGLPVDQQTSANDSNLNQVVTENVLADIGKQNLVQSDNGILVAVPIQNPVLAARPSAADLTDAQSHLVQAENQNPQTNIAEVNRQTEATTELALVVPQRNPENTSQQLALPPAANAQVNAGTQAAEKQATTALKRPSFLARLFKRPPAKVGPRDDRNNSLLASSQTASKSNTELRVGSASLMAMPGVKSNSEIFGIRKEKSDILPSIKLASAASMARLSPLGLRTQHGGVNVSCIRPEVLLILNKVERHYGKKPIVTSGYRSPSRNRKAGGARNSMHIYCKAVDVQIEGVSKWNLAKYLRTIPGRGGIGTYCRTKSVHIDIGPKRDWHYSCRRKSKRRRKA